MSNVKSKQRKLAEQLYVHADMSQKEIAADLDVSETTISKWKIEDRWEELRSAKTLTRDNIIKNCYEQALFIQELAQKEKRGLTSKEADALLKISCAIEKLDKSVSLKTVIQVFKEFNLYMVEVDVDFAKSMTKYQRSYLQSKAHD